VLQAIGTEKVSVSVKKGQKGKFHGGVPLNSPNQLLWEKNYYFFIEPILDFKVISSNSPPAKIVLILKFVWNFAP
jgi:hypothetical protein